MNATTHDTEDKMPDDPNTGEVEGTPPPWQTVTTPPKPDQDVQEAIRFGQVNDGAEDEVAPTEDDGTSGLEEERSAMHVDSAFVVFFQDGEAFGVGSLGTVSVKMGGEEMFLEPGKPASTAMMWRGCTEVVKDIEVHETAVKTVEALQAHTLQMHQALQQQKPGGGRLHVPGQ